MCFHSGTLAKEINPCGMAFKEPGRAEAYDVSLESQLRNGTLSLCHWLNQVTWACLT